MEVPLGIPPGPNQRVFLDHLNAALRPRFSAFQGSAGRRADGRYESTVSGSFSLGVATVPLVWTLVRAADGTLEVLQAAGVEDAPPEEQWRDAAFEFVTSVLAAALGRKTKKVFCRVFYWYIGPSLDGEYWLPGFRFAPALPDDEMPTLINAERVVSIDMEPEGVDDVHARTLAQEAARRHAARLSLLLNTELYSPEPDLRWVLSPPREGTAEPTPRRSQRLHLGFSVPEAVLTAMPEKGVVCPLGKYEGSLTDRYRYAGRLLSLPREARRILRRVDEAPLELRMAFDRGARLCQVAAAVERHFPSAGLAYRVAALDAISQANGSRKVLSDFVHKYATPDPALDSLVEYLWGRVRSGHFHGGEFPLGEFAPSRVFDPLMDSVESYARQVHIACYELTHEVMVRWIDRELAKGDPGEPLDAERKAEA